MQFAYVYCGSNGCFGATNEANDSNGEEKSVADYGRGLPLGLGL